MVATLLDGSAPTQRIVSIAEAVNIVGAGLRLRARKPGLVTQVVLALVVLAVAGLVVHVFVNPTPIGFWAASFVVALVPGTGVVYTVSTSVVAGWKRGCFAVVGCTLGILPHLAAATLGLSGMMQAGAEFFEVVRWVGVGYLIYLGVGMIRSDGLASGVESDERSTSGRRIIWRGVVLNLLNPKLTVFFFAFLPQFLSAPPSLLDVRLLGLCLVFMAVTMSVFLMYAAFAAAARERVLSTPRLLRRIEQSLGLLFLGFAVKVATSDR